MKCQKKKTQQFLRFLFNNKCPIRNHLKFMKQYFWPQYTVKFKFSYYSVYGSELCLRLLKVVHGNSCPSYGYILTFFCQLNVDTKTILSLCIILIFINMLKKIILKKHCFFFSSPASKVCAMYLSSPCICCLWCLHLLAFHISNHWIQYVMDHIILMQRLVTPSFSILCCSISKDFAGLLLIGQLICDPWCDLIQVFF